MELVESLKNLGISEKEAEVYLALLQLGKTTSYAIAVRSGLKKSTTYVVLDQLAEKGFVYKVPRANKQLYVAESPEKVVALAKEKVILVEKSLPELLASQKGKMEKVNVSYFEGILGIKEMYKKLIKTMREVPLKKREYLCFYGHGKDAPKEFFNYWEELSHELYKYGIKRRTFMPQDESVKWYFEQGVQLGLTSVGLPKESYSTNVSFEVFDKYIQIISHRYLQGTLIENRDVADALRQIFEIMWNVYKNKNTK